MTREQQYLEWPFFEDHHRELSQRLDAWCVEQRIGELQDTDVYATCSSLVERLGDAGWLGYCVPAGPQGQYGGTLERIDSRCLSIVRETLAHHHALADFAFAMQGLGSGTISLSANDPLKRHYLPRVAAGRSIAAFALSEPEAGSDVAALRCAATLEGEHYLLNGQKTWISNGGLADFYCVFARTDPHAGSRGISAFLVDADTPGLTIEKTIDVISPHPLALLNFENCRVPTSHLLSAPDQGFKLAMQTLDIFRCSVAAAALGFARRALHEGLHHARERRMFGKTLMDMQITQAAFGDIAAEVDMSALLVYRAAWVRDVMQRSSTAETAMAKMVATECSQRVIDRVLQMFGARGVVRHSIMERLYRDIRALRIYEGATEVQKLIIARELVAKAPAGRP